MEMNKYRIIKIGANALREFIYENIIEKQCDYFDVDPTEVRNDFIVDLENGQLIFCVSCNEDEAGNIVKFPKDIDLEKLMLKIPDTTKTMFQSDRYIEFSKDELLNIQNDSSPEVLV